MHSEFDQVDWAIYSSLVVHTAFLQLFLWERFKNYGPQPSMFEAINVVRVEDENGIVRSVPDKPEKMRAQKWSKLKQQRVKISRSILNSRSIFLSGPMNIPLKG